MRKQFSAPSIHFKGTGWAKKDRGGSSGGTKASAAKHTEPSESKSESTTSGSGESSSPSASSSESKD